MVVAAICFAVTFVLIRILSDTLHTFQIVLFRAIIAILLLLPWLMRAGLGALSTNRWGMYGMRAIVAYVAMVCWFYALGRMVLADASALQFTMPLWAVILAVLFLGERAGVSRWIATLVGFAGALVIIRPGLIDTNLAALAALVSAALYSGGNIFIKALSRTEDTTAIAFLGFVCSLPLAIPLAIIFWQPTSWSDAPIIVAFGLATVGAQVSLARAMSMADASLLGPVDYVRLPVVAGLGFVLFGEVPDLWAFIGALIIVGSTWYLTAGEARRSRSR